MITGVVLSSTGWREGEREGREIWGEVSVGKRRWEENGLRVRGGRVSKKKGKGGGEIHI